MFSIIKLFCFHNNRKLCSRKTVQVSHIWAAESQTAFTGVGWCDRMLGTKCGGFVLGTEAIVKLQSQTWVRTAANTLDALCILFWIKFCYFHFQKPDTIACLCVDSLNLQSSCNPQLLKLGYRTRDWGNSYIAGKVNNTMLMWSWRSHHLPTHPWCPSQAQSVCPQRPWRNGPWEDTDPLISLM